MTVSQAPDKEAQRLPTLTWTRIVTNLMSPPVVLLLTAVYVLNYAAVASASFVIYFGIYALFSVAPPSLYIGWAVYRGIITDIHMPKRSERFRPFILGVAGTIVTWVMLLVLRAPWSMMAYASFTVVDTLVITGITFFWQISIHAAAIGGATVIVGILSGPLTAAVVLPCAILVGIARIKLKRHTVGQVLAGATIGIATAIVFFYR